MEFSGVKSLDFPTCYDMVQDPFDWLSFSPFWDALSSPPLPTSTLNNLANLGVGLGNLRACESGQQNSNPGSVTLCQDTPPSAISVFSSVKLGD